MVVVLFGTGAILFSLGIIAEYIGVAVNMAMGKPPYLIISDPGDGPLGRRPAPAVTARSRRGRSPGSSARAACWGSTSSRCSSTRGHAAAVDRRPLVGSRRGRGEPSLERPAALVGAAGLGGRGRSSGAPERG